MKKLFNFKLTTLEKFVWSVYFLISTAFFILLYKNAPDMAGDAYMYNDLSTKLAQAKLNIFVVDFQFKTFVYPLFLAIGKIIADIVRKNPMHIIFVMQLIIFHFGNIVFYKTIKKYSSSVSLFFIALSSFNVINLSFSNLLLTENLSFLFTALIFYYFLKDKKSILDYILLAVVSTLAIYIRQTFLLLYIVIFLITGYQTLIKKRNILGFILYTAFSLMILSLGIINSYTNYKTYGIFSPKSTGTYAENVYHGSFLIKYETNIDKNEKSQIMQYVYKDRYYLLNDKCKDEILTCIGIYKSPQCPKSLLNCQMQSLWNKPLDYLTLTSLHLFSFFDRTYVETYITKIAERNLPLQMGNYMVLSGALLVFLIKKNKKFLSVLRVILLFILINTAIYLPTKVEPRFSSPIFPLLLILSSSYFVNVIKNKQHRYLWLNGILIGLFFLISELVNLTLKVSDIPVHLVK